MLRFVDCYIINPMDRNHCLHPEAAKKYINCAEPSLEDMEKHRPSKDAAKDSAEKRQGEGQGDEDYI
eukprot:2471371-Ditylum_brightwellii.AAC.1